MMLRADELLWDVEEQHLDEAEFLFEAREAACDSPDYSLAELATGPEQRLLGHIDALCVGGPVVAELLLLPTLEDSSQDYERIAAATLALCAGSPGLHHERLLAILDTAERDEPRRGVIRALELCDDPRLDEALVRSLTSVRGPGVAARLDVLAGRQIATGSWLSNFLLSDDLDVARAAARLARSCPNQDVLQHLGPLAQSGDPAVQRATLETALCRQLGGAWELAAYWALCPGESPFRRDALIWVALLGDAAAHQRILELLDDPQTRADALWAAGFAGRAAAVDRCMALLADEDVGQLAAEVVCEVAGLPRDDDRFWRAPPADNTDDALPPLERDDLDADLVPSGDAALPHPEPGPIRAWWEDRKGELHPALRYLGGRPLDHHSMIDALSHRSMRRRHNLALELAFRTAGAVGVSTRAWTEQQRSQLAGLAALPSIDVQRGLALR